MPTPQELMDLPYAGMAEKELRKHRLWQLTAREKIKNYFEELELAINAALNATLEIQDLLEESQ